MGSGDLGASSHTVLAWDSAVLVLLASSTLSGRGASVSAAAGFASAGMSSASRFLGRYTAANTGLNFHARHITAQPFQSVEMSPRLEKMQ